MSSIITPAQFKTVPWKNGKGKTIEMAIDANGTMASFDWRISQASVTEDGEFSDFTGYQRHLILLKGQGITLEHDGIIVDVLSERLDVAAFDGSCKTVGRLKSGPIIDFNLITRADKYAVSVETYCQKQTVALPQNQLCFVYCIDSEGLLLPSELHLPPAHLLQVTEEDNLGLSITGQGMIVIALKTITSQVS